MRLKNFVLTAATAIASATTAAPGVAAPAATSGKTPPRNIIFILVDDLRYDGLGFLQPTVQTPNIDRLARKFDTARAAVRVVHALGDA